MKKLFIPVYSKNSKIQGLKELEKLPYEIAIVYSIQFKELAEKIQAQLSKSKKLNSFIQVLGCSKPKIPKSTEAILLIGSGKFHAVSLAFETGKKVFVYDSGKINLVDKKETENLKKKQKASYLKFLNSDKIGILISTKPGQRRFEQSVSLKNSVKNKESYLFIGDNLSPSEFENFPQIQSWVNTACPRLQFDSLEIINFSDLNGKD